MSELAKSVPLNLSIYSSEGIHKKTVGLTVRQDLLTIAKEQEVNLSKLLESSLIQLLEPQTKVFSLSKFLFSVEKKALPR